VLPLLLASVAHAGACCVGSTSSMPTRVGECEHAVVGLSAGGELSTMRWDRDLKVRKSSMRDDALVSSISAGYRLDRRWQVGLSVPFRLTHRAVGDLDGWGGGVGDMSAQLLWDPVEERPRIAGESAPAVPIFALGVRAPTGRDWQASERTLQEDVTGLVGPGVRASMWMERTMDRVPWRLGASAEVGFSNLGPQPSVSAQGAVGHYFGTRWTAMLNSSIQMSWAQLGVKDIGSWRTDLGAVLVHGAALRWRVSGYVNADVPVPGLGRSTMQHARAGITAMKVF